ncbi:MAG: crosslink repair DNA glycosylase YcaQ family protein [Verrucomicrobiales bacterium]|nr:crosslink repair DNA glycosylase YcaQ family protein [Verrucomicrobiales bacterium]
MEETLSLPQVRKLVLLSQRVPPAKPTGSATAATLSAIEHLGYIQIDTISVVERAHDHTLWNRNPRYEASQLAQLLDSKEVFEYWSHAAAYLPMRDYRFSLPRKMALARGDQEHWYDRDDRVIEMVLERIRKEGPLMAKDFDNAGKQPGDWKAKPAKQALEYLFMQGDLMVPRRVNFHKVYDLTERVLPGGIDTSEPEPEEYARFLITRFLEANGLGRPAEFAYLRKNTKRLISATMDEMISNGELLPIRVEGLTFYTLPNSLEALSQPLGRSKLKILSPFDNLLIQRKRITDLFGFDYQIECYVPAAKRQYGYFSLPILWDGKLVARMDCKNERKHSLLHIHHLALEPHLSKLDAFLDALHRELKAFLRFNQCSGIQLHKVSPAGFKPALQAALDDLT